MYDKIEKLKNDYEIKLCELIKIRDKEVEPVVYQRFDGKIETLQNIIRDLVLML